MNELVQLTLIAAATAIRRKKISSVELTRACIEQAQAVQPKLNCFIALEEEDALKAARKADRALKRGTRLGPETGDRRSRGAEVSGSVCVSSGDQ